MFLFIIFSNVVSFKREKSQLYYYFPRNTAKLLKNIFCSHCPVKCFTGVAHSLLSMMYRHSV